MLAAIFSVFPFSSTPASATNVSSYTGTSKAVSFSPSSIANFISSATCFATTIFRLVTVPLAVFSALFFSSSFAVNCCKLFYR
jgi:hypothetical protein